MQDEIRGNAQVTADTGNMMEVYKMIDISPANRSLESKDEEILNTGPGQQMARWEQYSKELMQGTDQTDRQNINENTPTRN